ncbi:MAG: MoaD/ThiS family protein [Verrucomicrobia bacterium]|jgi:molybdopterin converting factor small subunit|nr:MoaD/ThiS family protein [Verrucomicrobiota bacterium]
MTIPVTFWSYFAELAGCSETVVTVSEPTTVDGLLASLYQAHPALAELRRSTLIAVGVEYQDGGYVLKPGDHVSLFPPVQGG